MAFAAVPACAQVQGNDGSASPAANSVASWDVISVRPDNSESGRFRIMGTSDGVHMQNVTVRMLAANASGVRAAIISGLPKWADSDHFDIDAKVSGEDVATVKDLTREQRRLMMFAILTERFGWHAHTETKELPIYELFTGRYDLELGWTPDPQRGMSHDDGKAPNVGDGASLFTPLQERAGLKRESSKGPVQTLVVDRVELPAEN